MRKIKRRATSQCDAADFATKNSVVQHMPMVARQNRFVAQQQILSNTIKQLLHQYQPIFCGIDAISENINTLRENAGNNMCNKKLHRNCSCSYSN